MNHKQEAIESIDAAKEQNDHQGAHLLLTHAQVHATLALVEQQRIANLIALSNATEDRYLTEPVPAETLKKLYEERGDLDCMISTYQLRPEIAEALELGETR